MKRRILSLLLVAVLLLATMPVSARANAASNIYVYKDEYYPSGALKSITTEFAWGSASVYDARLILSSKRLNGSTGSGGLGDFSDAGTYANSFSSYTEAKAHDIANGTFGFIVASDETDIYMYESILPLTLTIPEGTIPMDVNATYYVYLWVNYSGQFYPDNLICAIQVQNGVLKYAPGEVKEPSRDYRNYYDPNKFQEVQETPIINPPVDPPLDPSTHTCVKSGWMKDGANHWHRVCADPTCDYYIARTDLGPHVYTDGYDTDCNDCGYPRTAPAQRPETGDITHIPLWTCLFFGSMALLWMQMDRRRREQA